MTAQIRRILTTPTVGPLLALLVACVFFYTQNQRFATGNNLSLIIQQVTVVGTLAIGQTIIILTAGIDLSNGLIMAFSQMLMAKMAVDGTFDPVVAQLGLSESAALIVVPFITITIGMVVAIGAGLLNGLLVTRLNLPPFIVTLGTLNIFFALTRIYTISSATQLPDVLTFFGNTFTIQETRITYGTLMLLALVAITWYLLTQTQIGRHIYAVGDNPEAARLTGIPVKRVLLIAYSYAGFMYGMAALLLIARTRVGDPQAGQNSNLESITAVVLGGTSLFGGRGNIIGTLVGALIIGVLRNGLQLMGVPSIYQVLFTGILVITAVAVDQFSQRAG